MKTAICHYSLHRRYAAEKWDVERLASEVKRLGVHAVDYHVRFLGDPKTASDGIRLALEKHGLALAGLSMSNDFNQADSAAFREQVEGVLRWLPVAAELHAPTSRIFGGHIPKEQRADDDAKRAGRQRILDALGEIVREAERLGVVLALENHGGLPCLAEEQVDIIETINSPCLRATVDVGNYMNGGQEAHEGTAIAAKYAEYVHVKDFAKIPDDAMPWGWDIEKVTLGTGDVDLVACLRALRNVGYDGFVALEYEGKEPEETGVPKSVIAMKSAMQKAMTE